MAKVCSISGIYDDDECIECIEPEEPSVATNRVQVRQSPNLDTCHGHTSVCLTIDSGATGDMIGPLLLLD